MACDAGWSRRQFVTAAGLAGAATMLPGTRARAETVAARPYALVLTHAPASGAHGVVTVAVDGARWTTSPVQTMEDVRSPEAMAQHPTLAMMYVAHAAGGNGRGRPGASVTACAADGESGGWRAMAAQPVALSSLLARDLAVSPDGQRLLVAGGVGGVYSVLPLREDGSPGAVEHALKMTGGGAWRTLPQLARVLFHPCGVAYGTDVAMHRVRAISFVEGAPEMAWQFTFRADCGPTKMALSPAGDALFVVLRGMPGLAVFAVDAATGALLGSPWIQPMDGLGGAAVATDGSGERVYAATQEGDVTVAGQGGPATLVSVYSRVRGDRELRFVERVRVPEIAAATRLLVQGDELLVVGMGGVVAMDVGRETGRLGRGRLVVRGGSFRDAVVREL